MAAAVAQQQPAPEDIPKLTETVDVRVINVDVVVVDRKTGQAVSGLTKNDFTIFENGRPKEISNFYEVRSTPITSAPAPTAPAPRPRTADIPVNQRRRIIFFVDNLSLHPFNRNRVFKAMKEFARDVL